jgi:integrase
MDNIRRTRARPIDQAKPVSLDDLHKICAEIEKESGMGEKSQRIKAARDKAMILTLFYGGLRISECLAIELADIDQKETGAIITIRQSKTDPGMGEKIAIPKVGGEHCPIAALETWLDTAKLRGGSIFRMIDADGKITKKPMLYNYARTRIHHYATQAGLDADRIKTHGMRAGVLTALSQQGVDIGTIAKHARHKSPATTIKYIRPENDKLLETAPTRKLQAEAATAKKTLPFWKKWFGLA